MLVRVAALLVPALLLAREARACEPDLCPGVVAVLELAPASDAAIPTDGVVVLKAATIGELTPAALAGRTSLAVTQDGSPVAGALAPGPFAGLLIWRPDAPLIAGASYQVSGSLTNPDPSDGCSEATIPFAFAVQAATGPTAALAPVELAVVETYFDDPVLTLTTIVCCNDAYPGDQQMCGVSYGATWSKGACAATQTRGYLRVQLTGKPGVDPASAGQWARVLRQDGEVVASGLATVFTREALAPTCLAIDQVSLATGEVAAGEERCFGEGVALGLRPLDPAAALGEQCFSDLYTCEIDDDRWDPLRCKSWGPDAVPPGDDGEAPPEEAGCGCRSVGQGGGQGVGQGVGLLMLLGLARRRRRG